MKRLMPQLGDRDRRALRVGALVVLPVLLWSFLARPYLAAVSTARDAVAAERALLDRELALLAAAPAAPGTLARIAKSDSSTSATLFTALDAYAASAALTAHVSEAADASGVSLRQSETTPPSVRADGLVELGLDLQGEGDFEGMLDFLRALEAGDRLVHATRVSIERATYGLGSGDVLALTATVRSYARLDMAHATGAVP
jgi:hypothetical protein